ncbi:DNA topoisomerase (ATP-hydrolyzing) subunit B [Dehalococcoidia bacterium]|nr:DNA topoisomerase (ATP-hydrolyzing) subunit B [Dehalococcoidia bacterium]
MAEKNSPTSNQYTAKDIQVLEGLEAVRRRPGMYIGSTDARGLHHLIYEIVDNGVDEAMAEICDRITITIEEDGTVRVSDNGRGIPVDIHPTTGRPALETIMTTLHSGAKFGGGAYKVSGGLHGVGASVVNALSERMVVQVKRDGQLFSQEFARGKPTQDLITTGKGSGRGTTISFLPDVAIFGELEYDYDELSQRFRQMAYLNKGLRMHFESPWHHANGAGKWKDDFYFESGISSFVQHYINHNREVLTPQPIHIEKATEGTVVEVAMQYNTGFSELCYSFANCINTPDGGTHLTGFRTALTRAMNDYAKKAKILRDDQSNLAGEDVREGLAVVISVKLLDPEFEGQTKAKLGNAEIKGQVETIVAEGLEYYLEEHPQEARRILDKCLTSQKAREAARKARDMVLRKNAMGGSSLPGLLADCQERDPEKSELFLVEGPSAGGSAKMGRDKKSQAILPLKGKILNVEKAREEQVISHEEIRSLITALGTKYHSRLKFNGDEDSSDPDGSQGFDLDSLRYHKVIIMTDADVDGSHIRTLLLTLFYRHLRPLVEGGFLYIAQPPLYKVAKSKAETWLYSDEELDRWLARQRYADLKILSLDSDFVVAGSEIQKRLASLQELQKGLADLGRVAAIPVDFMLRLLRSNQGEWYRQEVTNANQAMLQTRAWTQETGEYRSHGYDKKTNQNWLEVGLPDGSKFKLLERHFESPLMRRCFQVYPAAKALVEGEPYTLRRRGKDIKTDIPWYELANIVEESADKSNITTQRYKGLGEMNPEQLWETTMDPETRTLLRVDVEDALQAEEVFSLLMGDAVAPRREFIQTRAREVRNLDV